MTVNIQYVQMSRSEAMDSYVNNKLEKLGKKYDWVISAEVHFEKENDPSGKGKICKIELSLPGPRIFATSNETTFENAVKKTIKDLEIQLKKRKQIFAGHK
ncbi:ribosome-associated translation inhibitor RaiA [Yeosuana sp. MJ-SS3]|uniref:Ribosome-associated translation inhibitor RaiA n=1 Tax=Gilvirhabdus luticola TaxID=3079858 RepID=A0ABU3U7U7_9FLAO|nr:ribosome-associated translation inhibitor RaiA [Yeosuana sp. MJ-SS3]MDU8886394.1 ribosome-associated translation inhibitor RaiA [Yeosuana sp. MJ-SS3]